MRSLLCRHNSSLCATALFLAVTASAADAAGIAWVKKGEFEACLESTLDKWVAQRAALEVDQAAVAAQLNDAAVASWTVETMAQCRVRGGAAEASSEERFAKHMAQWRQHIYDVAAEIRKRGNTD